VPSTASPVALPVASVRRRRHAAFGTLLALVLALAWLLPAAPAAAACDGVTVRVERSSGSVVERCVTGATPGTGLQALERAGFRYTFVPGQPGMVCTIDGHPDPCNDAPDDAYWAYWHADAGASSWTYSSRGGGNRGPSAGGHEAWVFGGGMQRPPSSPPPAPAPTPTPSPTSPPAAGGGTGSSAGSGSNGGAGSGSSGGVSASGSGSSGGSSSSGSGAGSTSGSGSTSGPGPSTGTAGGEGASPDRSADEGRPADPDAQADASSSGPGDGTSTSSDEDAPTDGGEDATAADASDRPRAHDAELATGDEVVGDRDADTRTEDDTEVAADPAEPDVVAIGAPSGGRSLIGVAVGGTLAVGLAGAAVVRSRRRGSDLGHEL
jgi:hypothetical protein